MWNWRVAGPVVRRVARSRKCENCHGRLAPHLIASRDDGGGMMFTDMGARRALLPKNQHGQDGFVIHG